MLTVGNKIKALAIDLDYLGQGVVKHEGYVIFVPKLLDYEEAIIEITKLNKNFGEAKVLEYITKSKDRVSNLNYRLGSIQVSHMSLKKQLDFQVKTTKDTFKKIANMIVETEEIITDLKDQNYRNKVLFHVIDDKYLKLGLFDESNKRLVLVNDFVLANQKANELLLLLNTQKLLIEPGILKSVIFRNNHKNDILVTLVSTKPKFKGLYSIVDLLSKQNNIIGITLNILDDLKNNMGKKSITLYNENLMVQKINQYEFLINDKSFFQVNLGIIEKVYETIKNHIKPNQIVLDLYSGVGSIGFYLADKQKQVIMVESNKDSVDMALMTMDKYNYQNVEIKHGFAEKEIKNIDGDVLIIDPPRNGLFEELIEEILIKDFNQIFYLSCDLKTLTKDLKMLSNKYYIKKVIPIKMFFHTNEFETLVIMEGK